METKLFSPLLSSANNIIKNRRSLPKREKEYSDFVNWLDSSNKEIKKIKLPKKKKVEDLQFSADISGGGGGGAAGGILGSLLSMLGIKKISKIFKNKFLTPRGKFKGNYEDIIKKLYKKTSLTKGEKFTLRDYERLVGKGKLTNNEAAFRALIKNSWSRNFTSIRGGGFSPEIASQFRQAGRAGGGGFAEAPRGRIGGGGFGKANFALNALFAGLEYSGRKQEGQSEAQALLGTGGGLAGGFAGAYAGGKAGAAIGAVIGAFFGGAGAVPGAVIGGFIGALLGGWKGSELGGNLTDKLTGADKIDRRLKEQEKRQKETATKSDVTFSNVTNKFDKVVSKFEKLRFGITGVQSEEEKYAKQNQQMNPYQEPLEYPPINPSQLTYDGPVSGDTFFPLPGGQAGREKGQQFGAPRDGGKRSHAGLDMIKWTGDIAAPVSAYKTGKVIASVRNGYNGYVTIDHGGGLKTRYYHTTPIVNVGDIVYGGQQIANLSPAGDNTHLHFEIYRGGTPISPRNAGLGQNIPAPLQKDKAKQQHEKNTNTITDKNNNPTIERQKTIEEFIKGKPGANRILNNPNLKAQLLGTKYEFKGSMVSRPTTDSQVKKFKEQYNTYVRELRQRRIDDRDLTNPTGGSSVDPLNLGGVLNILDRKGAPESGLYPPEVDPKSFPNLDLSSLVKPQPNASPSTIIINNGSSTAQAPSQIIPVPIPVGNNGGGGVVVASIPEGQIVNSMWKDIHLIRLGAC